MPNFISEDQIEKAILQVLTDKFGYRHINCFTSNNDDINDGSGRSVKSAVVLFDILKEKARELNPDIPGTALKNAVEKLTRMRYAMSPVRANREVYDFIKDGIPVDYQNNEGRTEHDRVKVIDFNSPDKNDFLAVSQLWIKGERYPRRPDIILYINGLPMVFIELKNSNIKLKDAYNDNLTNYKRDIPLLFQYNAFCILSNGLETKVGSFSAGWEHFSNWLRVEDEKEKVNKNQIANEGTSLQRAVSGLCSKERLLDYVENFILYYKESTKIIAQNHQFIGTNKVLDSFSQRQEKQGKLGVFWHTQGAGKSFSMIFFARKIFRKFPGNYTFVIITDREDLDGQIYRNFLDTDTVKKNEAARPKDSAEMRKYLGRNMRFVFTLIHKFRWDIGQEYPILSERDDIIVIVDEAHRTQYKSLAENMRKGLPNAQYIAFTGTPLLGNERKTNAWFGDYVSEYNFLQSVDDGATVPLFYQKRVAEVLIQNEDLSDEFYEILEDENLNDEQQAKLENTFTQEIEVIKRDDRLEKIAKDIVSHFPNRGYLGKGMVISVDKFTAVKMYDKVQRHWLEEIKRLYGQIHREQDEYKKEKIKKTIDYMKRVEMAVVISEEAGEEEKFTAQGLDIKPHRQKLNKLDKNGHDIEYRFKDPEDSLQLVFICAMWMTGFDVPTMSTMYLDKPMKGHTLMQAIARANRVTAQTINGVTKKNGEIIDYYNVFRSMRRALADYALGSGEEAGENPVRDKSELFKILDDALGQGKAFCKSIEIDLDKVLQSGQVLKNLEIFDSFADRILERDEWKKEFIVYENTISSLYEACKPEIIAKGSKLVPVFQYLRGIIDSIIQRTDVESAKRKISELLDQSVITANKDLFTEAHTPAIQIIQRGKTLDLSKINYEKLKADFKEVKYKNIEIANLRAFIEDKLDKLIQQNSTRVNFAQKLQEIIDKYNAGGSSNENYFNDLIKFTESLKQEDERHIREGLSEDELELFDVLKKDKMTKDEEQKIKLAAKALLHRLVEEQPKILVQDWWKDMQSKEKVKSAIDDVLDSILPESFNKGVFQNRSGAIFNLAYEYASKGLKWAG